MMGLRAIVHMMRADYKERTRRYGFLITALLSTFVVYKFLPTRGDGYTTLALHGVRGLYNSAWVGSAIAILASMLLSLPAFFLVKNAIERDVNTGVGQILATTPMTRWMYTLGKMCSHFLLLLSLICVLIITALAVQLIRGEVYTVDPAALLLPFLYSTIPTMAIVAALAILFEAVPLLQRGFGNLMYFALWIVMLRFSTTAPNGWTDVMGLSPLLNEMSSEALSRVAQPTVDHVSGISIFKGPILTYEWNGVDWDLSQLLVRYVWLLAALLIVWVASLFFHRFDLTRLTDTSTKRKRKAPVTPAEAEPESAHTTPHSQSAAPFKIKLTPYGPHVSQHRFGALVAMELRLLLKGLPLWWHIAAAGMVLLGLFLPTDAGLKIVLPLTWVWPVLIWSSMGTNEARYRTEELIFTAAHAVRHQLAAIWLAGVAISVLTGSGALLHLLAAAEWEHAAAMAVGALFIPSLALALGVWSGSGKLFQMVFLLLWYIGPLNKLEELDFIGSTPGSLSQDVYLYCLLGTGILLLAALLGRLRQMRAY